MNSNTPCWPFNPSENPPFPELMLNVRHPHQSYSHEIKSKVDTGFSGVLGLPLSTIRELELPSVGSTEVKTALGVQSVPLYKIIIFNKEIDLPEVKTAVIPTERAIIGRSLLVNRVWLLDGKRNVFCFINE